jgi:hypothetical protein
MRVFAQCAAVGCLAAIVALSGTVSAQTKDPAAVLAAARQALGGEKKLSAVKSFTATGRTRQVRGDNLVPIEFEIFVELPDKYLRKDEIPAQESGPTASGFNGDEWLQDPPPPAAPAPPPAPAGATGPPRNPSAARVATLKQDFARLTLGMFASSFPAYPLTFTYVGEAEAPQGKADVLDAKGPNNFTIRLFIGKDTHLPIMVSWTGAPAGRGARPGGPGGERPSTGSAQGAAPPARERGAPPTGERGAAPAAPVENRLYFADYRDVDGLQFPFRLRRAVGTDTIEETTFDRFKINTKIDSRKFDVRKPQ